MNVWKGLAHHLVPSVTFWEQSSERTYGANVGCLAFFAMHLEDYGDPSGYAGHLLGQT